MEWRRIFFDSTAYMLFEETGDSEVQCFNGTIVSASEMESDDAESCSDGSSTESAHIHEVEADGCDFGRHAEYFTVHSESEEVDGGGIDEEEDGVVDQRRGGFVVVLPNGSAGEALEPNGFKDLKAKAVNERETDRRFWEACLAS